mmetsp:Transcript_6304/g.11907  ORF Transcript_6304/g.11907 Transcript_6304/m.11907 type:complete len:309 (-) Transcript_6304:145-1071(-)|eukprot:CAMPEP_0176493322 /NCGR_PEP_ID=MMETSP0200_2-20121128/9489_1 /TAXON_ID=947934 /ORGANISM="Chaetoceros sp., Strain GSL56" /LENGTH=308 /DNA_ID=CAMNT_0017890981 /DNA_START=51 /DNA_END=977 /DNA_ORIENTATION=-
MFDAYFNKSTEGPKRRQMSHDPLDDLVFRRRPSSGLQQVKFPTRRKKAPRVNVKILIHEEVAATQDRKSSLDDVSSHVMLDGTVDAIVSSLHPRNPPFSIRILDPDYPEESQNSIQFNSKMLTFHGPLEYNTISVPKAVREVFNVASYHRSITKQIMPVLVQSRVHRFGENLERCEVAVQIRSNLNNIGNLKEITLAVAVPPTIIGKTIRIVPGPGNGEYDDLRRVILWKMKELNHGSSIVFSAEATVVTSKLLMDDLPKFPILLRCKSTEDTVSSIQVDCKQLDVDHPITLNVTMERSFQLLHRLPL